MVAARKCTPLRGEQQAMFNEREDAKHYILYDDIRCYLMNMQKYETYKSIYESLTKSLKYGFYYEAIFLEYAILEDRLASVLKYAEIPYIDKNGRDVSISKKLNLIGTRKELAEKFYKDRLTPE